MSDIMIVLSVKFRTWTFSSDWFSRSSSTREYHRNKQPVYIGNFSCKCRCMRWSPFQGWERVDCFESLWWLLAKICNGQIICNNRWHSFISFERKKNLSGNSKQVLRILIKISTGCVYLWQNAYSAFLFLIMSTFCIMLSVFSFKIILPTHVVPLNVYVRGTISEAILRNFYMSRQIILAS